MVPVAQWQSASLWMTMLWVRNPSGTPQNRYFCLIGDLGLEKPGSFDFKITSDLGDGTERVRNWSKNDHYNLRKMW